MITITFNFLLGYCLIAMYWQILSYAIKNLLSIATGHGYIPFMPKHFLVFRGQYLSGESDDDLKHDFRFSKSSALYDDSPLDGDYNIYRRKDD